VQAVVVVWYQVGKWSWEVDVVGEKVIGKRRAEIVERLPQSHAVESILTSTASSDEREQAEGSCK
jgi:hypothetical protein